MSVGLTTHANCARALVGIHMANETAAISAHSNRIARALRTRKTHATDVRNDATPSPCPLQALAARRNPLEPSRWMFHALWPERYSRSKTGLKGLIYKVNSAAFRHDRDARTTPAMVSTSAAIWPGPSGSPSANAEAKTPMTGTKSVPMAATEAGKRWRAANQHR